MKNGKLIKSIQHNQALQTIHHRATAQQQIHHKLHLEHLIVEIIHPRDDTCNRRLNHLIKIMYASLIFTLIIALYGIYLWKKYRPKLPSNR